MMNCRTPIFSHDAQEYQTLCARYTTNINPENNQQGLFSLKDREFTITIFKDGQAWNPDLNGEEWKEVALKVAQILEKKELFSNPNLVKCEITRSVICLKPSENTIPLKHDNDEKNCVKDFESLEKYVLSPRISAEPAPVLPPALAPVPAPIINLVIEQPPIQVKQEKAQEEAASDLDISINLEPLPPQSEPEKTPVSDSLPKQSVDEVPKEQLVLPSPPAAERNSSGLVYDINATNVYQNENVVAKSAFNTLKPPKRKNVKGEVNIEKCGKRIVYEPTPLDNRLPLNWGHGPKSINEGGVFAGSASWKIKGHLYKGLFASNKLVAGEIFLEDRTLIGHFVNDCLFGKNVKILFKNGFEICGDITLNVINGCKKNSATQEILESGLFNMDGEKIDETLTPLTPLKLKRFSGSKNKPVKKDSEKVSLDSAKTTLPTLVSTELSQTTISVNSSP